MCYLVSRERIDRSSRRATPTCVCCPACVVLLCRPLATSSCDVLSQVEKLALTYLGTVPPAPSPLTTASDSSSDTAAGGAAISDSSFSSSSSSSSGDYDRERYAVPVGASFGRAAPDAPPLAPALALSAAAGAKEGSVADARTLHVPDSFINV